MSLFRGVSFIVARFFNCADRVIIGDELKVQIGVESTNVGTVCDHPNKCLLPFVNACPH